MIWLSFELLKDTIGFFYQKKQQQFLLVQMVKRESFIFRNYYIG